MLKKDLLESKGCKKLIVIDVTGFEDLEIVGRMVIRKLMSHAQAT